MKPIETPRLNLRRWYESDAKDLFAYARLPQVGPAAGWRPHKTLYDSVDIIRRFIAEDETWAIVEKLPAGSSAPSAFIRTICARSRTAARWAMCFHRILGARLRHGSRPGRARVRVLDLALGLVSVSHFPGNHASKKSSKSAASGTRARSAAPPRITTARRWTLSAILC